jgi:hypothetical protein
MEGKKKDREKGRNDEEKHKANKPFALPPGDRFGPASGKRKPVK